MWEDDRCSRYAQSSAAVSSSAVSARELSCKTTLMRSPSPREVRIPRATLAVWRGCETTFRMCSPVRNHHERDPEQVLPTPSTASQGSGRDRSERCRSSWRLPGRAKGFRNGAEGLCIVSFWASRRRGAGTSLRCKHAYWRTRM